MDKLINSEIRLDQDKIDHRYFYRISKRIVDIIASGLGLIILSPLFLVLGILIYTQDKGPIFYSQIRIGRNGKKFKMYKLRSMVTNADELLAKLKEKNEVEGPMFKMKDDPRITKVGKFIRKTSLDELPQLYNVFAGHMSLVGLRPPLVGEVEQYSEYDKQRLWVTPGCTGLWQATERNSVGFHEMVELDLEYIEKSSLFFDFYLILKTIKIMVHPNGAY
ncbi:MAG TPA: sugar transferase [Candidatus Ligilactobacillus excrementipullorum]|nr:sugar transferase [Candidatus Ligilactobacillus excrementipullorum]